MVECLNELAVACGDTYGEWGVLTDTEQRLIFDDFVASHPPEATLARAARAYYQSAGPG